MVIVEASESLSVMEVDNEDEELNSSKSSMKERILDCVAKSDGFFKSQQVGEEDLTFSEKHKIASELLDHNMALFLQRYWKYIKTEDVDYFDSSENYEVQFYVQQMRRSLRSSKLCIKNRRYEALKKMLDEGSYFSDSEMKKRNPFLYEQLVGQYLTENERVSEYKKLHADDRFSNFLMGQIERNVENRLYDDQKEEDENEVESENEEEDSESEMEDETPPPKNITKQEQSLLKKEFMNVMFEHFLAGKDLDFDYSTVDNNADYDSIEQRNLDEEEKYFDDD